MVSQHHRLYSVYVYDRILCQENIHHHELNQYYLGVRLAMTYKFTILRGEMESLMNTISEEVIEVKSLVYSLIFLKVFN